MKTEVIQVSEEQLNNGGRELLSRAAELLQQGELVAFPTETVYGLGGDALREDAARKIYAAKGRPSDNPLIVHVSTVEQVEKVAEFIPEKAKLLMERFWPGPMTLVFRKREIVPDGTTGGLATVAVRMPSHKVARALIDESGVLIAAPSANLSGRPSPTKAEHVVEDMNGRIPMILDGGAVGIGIESTIVDVTEEIPMILRPGFITQEMLVQVVGEVQVDPAILAPPQENLRPKAPGMKYRHYAPKAPLTLYEGSGEKVVEHINELCKKAQQEGKRVGVLACDDTKDRYQGDVVISVGNRLEEESIARHLYDALRAFDETQVDVIYGESFESKDLGRAIMNRLMKAAGYHKERINE